jgi:hypothetical protein
MHSSSPQKLRRLRAFQFRKPRLNLDLPGNGFQRQPLTSMRAGVHTAEVADAGRNRYIVDEEGCT